MPVSAELAEQLDLFHRAGTVPAPDVPTPASAVVLVRDSSEGLQTFVTRQSDARGNTERGRWGFPSGTLNAADIRRLPLAAWSAERCARALRVDNTSRGLQWFAAAVRTSLSHLGVLLAEDSEGRLVASTEAPANARERLATRGSGLAAALADRDLRMRPDLLRPWLRWINTPMQLRRFDTVFFLASVPHGQVVDLRSPNEVWGGWLRPAEILERANPDSADNISAPVRLICESLMDTPTVGSAMARVRDLAPFEPDLIRKAGRWWVSLGHRADPSERGRLRELAVLQATQEEESRSLVDDDVLEFEQDAEPEERE
ncbi:hypothetical protein [Brevibacterium samyangense]|uniref:NUDIX hydrolase n=1 Tax=Brevibacterium samyangense TaxID=366888 RepID=A0ABN2T5C4_9MICO